MNDELHLYPKRSKLLFGAVGAAGVLVILGWGLITGPEPDAALFLFREPLVFYMLLGVFALLFGYLLTFALRNLLWPRPWAVLTPEGLAVDGINYSFGARWSEIEGLSIMKKRRSNTFVLRLRDPLGFVQRQSGARPAATARALITRFGSPFLLDMGALNANQHEVARYLDARLLPLLRAGEADAEPADDRAGDRAGQGAGS